MRLRFVVMSLLVSVASGCGDDDVAPGDASTGDDAGSDSGVVAPPAAPAAPELAPCPDGWEEITAATTTTTCEPRSGGSLDCTGAEAHFLGDAACTAVGSGCPAGGEHAEDLPSDSPIVYALAGSSGGDGSMAAPFGTVSTAVGRATRGAVVAVGRGRYVEQIGLRRDVTLWGACPAETVLTFDAFTTAAGVVVVGGEGTEVRNLSISEAARPGIFARAGTGVTLRDVVVAETTFSGLIAFGGRVDTEHVVVRDTAPVPGAGDGGAGLVNLDGASTLVRTVFERNRDVGAVCDGPMSTMSLEDVVVRETQYRLNDLQEGRGLDIAEGSTGTATRVLLEGNYSFGIRSTGPGTVAMLDRLVVRDTRLQFSDRTNGLGAVIGNGVDATITKSVFERNLGVALVGVTDATYHLRDVVLRDTEPADSGYFGRGLGLQLDATADGERVAIENNHDHGVFVGGAGAHLVLTDLVVRDTKSQAADGSHGRAIEVLDGGTIDSERVLLERNRDLALVAFASGSSVVMRDLVVTETMEQGCAVSGCAENPAGTAVAAVTDAAIRLTGVELRDNALCGVLIARGGVVDLERGTVRNNLIGACVQVDGFDFDRLTNGVEYDNPTNLEATMLPVPEASVAPP